MEEILASIRRIISEDDAPEGEAQATPPHADEPPTPVEPEPPPPVMEAAPPAPPEAPEPEDDDALELTERVETHGDLDVYTPAEPEPAPPPPEPEPEPVAAAPVPEPAPVADLVSAGAAAAAASAFGKLSAAVAMPAEGRTLEDVVRELLRPLLHQWLDDNLPAIVREAVETEVGRIARARR